MISEGTFRIIKVESVYDHKITNAMDDSDADKPDQLIPTLRSDSLILPYKVFFSFSDLYLHEV